MKTKQILNTDIVKIEQEQDGFHTYVKMQEGGWLEMATYQNDLKGLVNALDLATNCCAGKFYPKQIAMTDKQLRIEVKND